MVIKKRLYKHNFLKGGPLKFDWTEHIPNFDFAQLYPQTQRVHHVVPETVTLDHTSIIGDSGRSRSNVMDSMYEMVDNLRNEGWTITTNNTTPNNPIDGYGII